MNLKKLSSLLILILCFSLIGGQIPIALAQTNNASLENLSAGKKINGFRANSVYLDDADKPLGGRFVHERTGFTIDLLQIQSVPQSFIWVKSFPVSDMGEPHTQEHLLIGKGNKGRNINVTEGMSLAQSTASTSQYHTIYQFNTAGGTDAFYSLFNEYLDVL